MPLADHLRERGIVNQSTVQVLLRRRRTRRQARQLELDLGALGVDPLFRGFVALARVRDESLLARVSKLGRRKQYLADIEQVRDPLRLEPDPLQREPEAGLVNLPT